MNERQRDGAASSTEVWQALPGLMLAHGLDPLFGLMGDANMRYLGDYQRRGGRFVAAAHEGAAVAMADGYSRASGRIGIASVTHGPGFTNTITQLVEASRNRSELLVLTGSAPPEPTYPQRLDIPAAAHAGEVGYERVHDPDQLARDLNRTLQRIVAERRPFVLDVPATVMAASCAGVGPVVPPRRGGPLPITDVDLDRCLGLLLSANRPVIVAGWGAVTSGARDQLAELAERTGAVLATTLKARDLFRSHDRDLGIFGNLSHDVAAEVIAEADAVIAFGASLNLFTTFSGELLVGKRVAHIDHDATRIGEYAPVDEGIVADAAAAATAMNGALAEFGEGGSDGWAAGVAERLRNWETAAGFEDRSGADTVDLRSAMIALDAILPEDRTVVCDVGRFTVGVWPYLRGLGPNRLINMGAFASIGLGLAGAIGAAVARPSEPTVAVLGDGGFMMNPAELVTAARYLDRFTVIVCNDGAYGAEYYRLGDLGIDPAYSTTRWPPLGPVAQALGIQSITITSLDDLEQHRELLAMMESPVLVDLRLDPDVNVLDW